MQRTYNYCHCRPRSRLSWLKMLLAFLLPGGGCLGRPWTGDCWGCTQGVRGSVQVPVLSQPRAGKVHPCHLCWCWWYNYFQLAGLTIGTLCSNEACYLSWMHISFFFSLFVYEWASLSACVRETVCEWVCERESLCDNTTKLLLNKN